MIISLCASHIDSIDRLESLGNMLNSVDRQSLRIMLYMSMSCDTEYTVHVSKYISSWTYKYDWLNILQFSLEKHSQFNHYAIIRDNLVGQYPKDTWLLFTDDDDTWHPDRALMYDKANKENVQIITYTGGRKCSDIIVDIPTEYVEFSVRLDAFNAFCDITTKHMRDLRGCDLIFRNYLWCLPYKVYRTSHWLYDNYIDTKRCSEINTYIDEATRAWKQLSSSNSLQIKRDWINWAMFNNKI